MKDNLPKKDQMFSNSIFSFFATKEPFKKMMCSKTISGIFEFFNC
jgi:hypothetical protein